MEDELEKSINEESKLKIILSKWKHRRRMAWVSLLLMVVMTISLFFFIPEAKLDKLEDVISWAYMAFASIVGAYMGLATFEGVKNKK